MVWIFIHNLYYQPLAGILNEPFFSSDGDVGFVVNKFGRIISPIVYTIIFFVYEATKQSIVDKK